MEPKINLQNNSCKFLSLKFSDKNLEQKFGNIFDKRDVFAFRILYFFVLLGSIVILILEILQEDYSESSNLGMKNYLLLIDVILYLLFGFVAFSKKFYKNTSLYLLFLYIIFIILKFLYEMITSSLSKIMTGLILSSLINMLIGPVQVIAITLIFDIFAIARLFDHTYKIIYK